MAKAAFGAGCFWHTEADYMKVAGVTNTAVGYMGGKTENPSYEEVCSSKTGHVEVCEVEYEPSIVSYEELLRVFWDNHDPTQLNRQGPDVGEQYRSVIFYFSDEQKETAEKSLAKEQANHKEKIVTAIEPAAPFYRAEEYHQQYIEKGGNCGI